MRIIPRTRFGMWWRIAVGCVLVVGFAAATTAVAGLLQVKNIANDFVLGSKPLKHIQSLQLPAPGKPETFLLIGADKRLGSGVKGYGNTDTMMLVRINDSSSTINLLSVPRDLKVTDPSGGITKLNAIYSGWGPNALIKTLSTQIFPGMKVNHLIIVSFLGFSHLIDAIGCVYADVDHRYYNNTNQTGWSSINIQPGYQRLCGWDASANGALAFVRFRHTDSDLVREARQQDFIRWAKQNFSTSELVSKYQSLLKTLGKYSNTDSSFASSHGLLDLAGLFLHAAGHTMKSIPFETAGEDNSTGGDYLLYSSELDKQMYREFMTPTRPKKPSKPASTTRPAANPTSKPKRHKHKVTLSTYGLVEDTGDGKDQAAKLGHLPGLPIYYPKLILGGGAAYCYTITANCNDYPNPPEAYDDSYPRRYEIKAPDGHRYRSYVFTIDVNSALGEYYTVQGTAWKDAPILRHPTKVLHVDGKKLYEYENGGKLSVVAIRTSHGAYWIANTLNDSLTNSEMLSLAASLTPAD